MKFINVLNDEGIRYRSYADFFQLIELSGFETVHQDACWREMDGPVISYINNGNAVAWAKEPRRCKLILWQLERWLGTAEEYAPPFYDEVWITDRWQASELQRLGHMNVRYVPLGSHAGLGGEPSTKKYDLAPMCYAYGQRLHKINVLAQKYKMAPTCWPPDRDRILSETRAGLCLHQWENDPALEPLRAAVFAAWKMPMVCAYCRDYYPYDVYDLTSIDAALRDERGTVQRNYDLVTGPMSFKRNVEAAL